MAKDCTLVDKAFESFGKELRAITDPSKVSFREFYQDRLTSTIGITQARIAIKKGIKRCLKYVVYAPAYYLYKGTKRTLDTFIPEINPYL